MTRPERTRGWRPANASMWRTAVLLAIHFVILVHITHWLVNGTTLTGIGPDGAMELPKNDIVNAGLVFFAAAVLTSAVFGRFFCGWGCHLVALQDLCRWLLLKIGIRPRPLRSRLLRFVPWLAFTYMFLWPAAYRLWAGDDFSRPSTEWMTTNLWTGLPGFTIAVITLSVCGFLIVYVLGSKGFCTYACPYGALIGAADRFAPFRVRVTDACRQCAMCTANCTSNVRVHEEVRDFAMVVDRGCMRCMDCIGACPNGALFFGAGLPSVIKKASPDAKGYRRRWNVTWAEEALLVAVFAAAFLTLRGLYGAVPFLLSLGASSALSFLCLVAVRLVTKSNVSFGGWRFERNGTLTVPGRFYLFLMMVILLFFAHSAVVRWHEHAGDRFYSQTAAYRAAALDLNQPLEPLTGGDLEVAQRATHHIELAERWGLFSNPRSHLRLAWLSLMTGQRSGFDEYSAAAVEVQPFSAELHLLRGREFADRGLFNEAVMAFVAAVEAEPTRADGYHSLGTLSARLGDFDRAIEVFERGMAVVPGSAILRYDAGVALALRGDTPGAVVRFEEVLELEPENLAALENLAGALISLGRADEAVEHLKVAARLAPGDPSIRLRLAEVFWTLGDLDGAQAEASAALSLDPEIEGATDLLSEIEGRR